MKQEESKMKKIIIIDDLFADYPEYESELRQKVDPNIELEIISGPNGTTESEFGPLGVISQKALERVLSSDQEGVHYIVDIGFEGGLGLREHPAIKPIIERTISEIERGSPEDLDYGVLLSSQSLIYNAELSHEIEKANDRETKVKRIKSMNAAMRCFLKIQEPQIEPLTGLKVDEDSVPLSGLLDVFVEHHLRPTYKGRVISKYRPSVDYKAGVLFRAYLQEKGISVTTFTSDYGHGAEGIQMLRPLGIIKDDDLLEISLRARGNQIGLVHLPEYGLAFNKGVNTYVELIHTIVDQ
jgi:hypothetical protein